METHILSANEQYLINRIAQKSIEYNPNLDFNKSYVITLLYYLMQFCKYKIDTIPEEYSKDAETLYKSPNCSYLHYWNKIKLSKSDYVHAIKCAEIEEIGDDPRCPWL